MDQKTEPPVGDEPGEAVLLEPGERPSSLVPPGTAGSPPRATGDEGADDDNVVESVQQPAKVMRIGSMVKQLLDEVRAANLDEASRSRLREIYEQSVRELAGALSPDLAAELDRMTLPFDDTAIPSEAELRVAQAQLVGWLEGLFHGIQATLLAQQMAARAQLEEMRQRGLPRGPGARTACRPGPAPICRLLSSNDNACDFSTGLWLSCGSAGWCGPGRPHSVSWPPRRTADGRHGFVRASAHPHRVLDARRRVPARRPRRSGGGRRPAGARDHRPREHVRGPRLLRRVPQPRHQSRHRHRGLHGGRVAPRTPRPPWQASTTPVATSTEGRSSTTT